MVHLTVFVEIHQSFHLVISGALQPIRDEFQLNDVLSELIVGATTLGAIIGGLFAGFVSFRITIFLACF
jgi:hypothetical protein